MSIEIRAAKLSERNKVRGLIDLAFDAEPVGPSLADPCESVGLSHLDPHDRPERTRVLLAGGQIVCVVHVAWREAYVCGAGIPFGFVAMVATHPDHRGRGYAGMLMQDAEEFMRSRGLCYAVLTGLYRTYCGSMGWRPPGEKRMSPPRRLIVPASDELGSQLSVRLAGDDDVPFLAGLYRQRCIGRFGPVARSRAYWRQWSLQRAAHAHYVIVGDPDGPIGYFSVSLKSFLVEEVAWTPGRPQLAAQVFLAARSWTARSGAESVSFHVDDADPQATDALTEAFGDLSPAICRPDGAPADSDDPKAYLPENWPEGSGLLVKYLGPGEGILSDVDSTDALTAAMAAHDWTYFDVDVM